MQLLAGREAILIRVADYPTDCICRDNPCNSTLHSISSPW